MSSGESRALRSLIGTLSVDVAVALGAEFLEGRRSRLGSQVAGVAPGFAYAAAGSAPKIVSSFLVQMPWW